MSEPAKHLRWLCRRGMLELDVIFERFLERGYQTLTQPQQELFERLLKEQDPILYSWFLGYEQPLPEYQELVALIRDVSQG